MEQIKEVNERCRQELKAKQQALDEYQARYETMDDKMKAMAYSLNKYQVMTEELKAKNVELDRTVNDHLHQEGELVAEKAALQDEVVRRKKEIKKVLSEVQYHAQKSSRTQQEKDALLSERNESERYRVWLKDEMKVVLRSVDNQKHDAETDEKLIKELQQQVKRLTASLKIAQEKNVMQFKLVEDHEAIKQTLEDDILAHKREEQKLRKRNYELEKQREKAAMNASNWSAKYGESVEQIKLREMECGELHKNIQEERSKLKLQQTLYEQVRSDRNLFSKQHIQSQDEIAEMNRKFRIMSHQVDQLKEEIQVRSATTPCHAISCCTLYVVRRHFV
jgi:chromosome segregation ATPase